MPFYITQPSSAQIPYMDIVSLAASVVSLFISVLAIALAIKFFRMSNEQGQRSIDSAASIKASVDKLESLSSILHTQILSMVQDTLKDYREHACMNRDGDERDAQALEQIRQEMEAQQNEKIENIRRDNEQKLDTILGQLDNSHYDPAALRKEAREVIGSVVTQTMEAKDKHHAEELKLKIMDYLQFKVGHYATRIILMSELEKAFMPDFSREALQRELADLKGEGVIKLIEGTIIDPKSGRAEKELTIVIDGMRLSDLRTSYIMDNPSGD